MNKSCSVNSYGVGSGLSGIGSWSTRGVGGVSGDSQGSGLFGTNRQQADRLPACEHIPKLLCCTERVLDKCLTGCLDYVAEKCPHKMRNYDKIISGSNNADGKTTTPKTTPNQQTHPPLTTMPTTLPELTTQDPRRQQAKKPAILVGPKTSPQKLFQLSSDGHVDSGEAQRETITHKNYGDYIHLNQRYPITEDSDSKLSSDCGVETSRPPYSPCLSRKLVPSNCHSLCTYEHREHVAAETLIQAIQQDVCDLKYLSNILYCANRNRDNRKCCQFLGMAQPELGVGDRYE
ncbi:unnamed protein product [Gongylonema pulchrum]|uniref:DB domain-containing protein n=1 Tax=Gongylonema pulchrum TaxID=637853 RepID=A0A183CWC6_9BILA|nr:unnamed protein product [Gongylonema pulchrum]